MSAIWGYFAKGTGWKQVALYFCMLILLSLFTFRSFPHHKFHISGQEASKGTCKTCSKQLSVPGGTTSSLQNHLKKFHVEKFQEFLEVNTTAKSKRKPAEKRSADEAGGSKPHKQVRLEDCLPQNVDNLSKQLDDAIVDFLAESGVAFRVVGLESFERLLKLLNKRVNLKHRTTYSKLVKVKAAEIKQEILDIINTVKGDITCAAFTTDMWTSAAGDPFMSLTIHFIDKHWRLHR